MSSHELPERASLEFLKKLSKERLRDLQRSDPGARLADAQLAVAREHGFASWRALKAEVERRRSPTLAAFFAACAAGDVGALRALLAGDRSLVRERSHGSTGLHLAVRHPEAVRLLLAQGADPDARDVGDNALALHFAAGGGPLESVQALLDAGTDVHGFGDAHRLEVIGWATVFAEARRDVVALLIERGARHHVFSAIALGDLEFLQRVVEDDPGALSRRLAHSEQEQTALHYVIAPPDGLVGGRFRTGAHYRTLELLIDLGADLEAQDARGRTPLAVAMLRGDEQAMRRLHAAGAKGPEPRAPRSGTLAELSPSIGRLTPMLGVRDMQGTLDWYRAIGFELEGSHADDGQLDWACVEFGDTRIMFVPSPPNKEESLRRLSFWIVTSRLDELYARFKDQQLERSRAALAGETTTAPEVRFAQDLHTAFYGLREFSIRDPNGLELYFYQPVE